VITAEGPTPAQIGGSEQPMMGASKQAVSKGVLSRTPPAGPVRSRRRSGWRSAPIGHRTSGLPARAEPCPGWQHQGVSNGELDGMLTPVYPFNEPSQPIVLYDGPIAGLTAAEASGVIELSCIPRPSLDWSVRPGASPEFANRSQVTLTLHRHDRDMHVPGWVRGIDGGWSNGAVFGRDDMPLTRIVAHWFNLPRWYGPAAPPAAAGEVSQRSRPGRWGTEADGWKITLDARPDHQRVWADLHKADVYVMTHVMELRRADGASFMAAEADPVLTALHVGVSFALGRWAAPMLPVGQDASGTIVWEDWRPAHCDPARSPSPGWWYEQDYASLADLLNLVIRAFSVPGRLTQLRLQMMLAIMATNDQGFVEQRIISGAAGLEHLAWQALVISGRMSKDQYQGKRAYRGRKLAAHDRLRILLKDAQIPVGIDASLLPVTARFAAQQRQRQGKEPDGADVVTWTRNRLVHPQGAQENVYQLNGLPSEVWLLTRHYLALLILHGPAKLQKCLGASATIKQRCAEHHLARLCKLAVSRATVHIGGSRASLPLGSGRLGRPRALNSRCRRGSFCRYLRHGGARRIPHLPSLPRREGSVWHPPACQGRRATECVSRVKDV